MGGWGLLGVNCEFLCFAFACSGGGFILHMGPGEGRLEVLCGADLMVSASLLGGQAKHFERAGRDSCADGLGVGVGNESKKRFRACSRSRRGRRWRF